MEDSKIHHYRDDAVWIDRAISEGIAIRRNEILRGKGLADDKGLSAVRAIQSSPLIIEDNDIYDYDHNVGSGWTQSSVVGGGIVVANGLHWCLQVPATAQQVLSEENNLVGPGESWTNVNRTALNLDWACGGGERTVDVKKNAIWGWSGWGVEMDQCIDVQLTCNLVKDNREGAVDYSRNTELQQPETRLKKNYLVSNLARTLQTDVVKVLALGPWVAPNGDRGRNTPRLLCHTLRRARR